MIFFSIDIPLPCFPSRALCSSDGSESEVPGARGRTGMREGSKAARASLGTRAGSVARACTVCPSSMHYFGDVVCAKRSHRGVFARPLPHAPFWVLTPLSVCPQRLPVATGWWQSGIVCSYCGYSFPAFPPQLTEEAMPGE